MVSCSCYPDLNISRKLLCGESHSNLCQLFYSLDFRLLFSKYMIACSCSKVWQSSFEHLLRIRSCTHHSKCSICMKRRLIIKKVGHSAAAARAQHKMLQLHLSRQHADRQLYWSARARSRVAASTSSPSEITAIIDSMDAQKHAFPRSRSMSSKEFARFNRPRLTSTSVILHGHMVLIALSPHLCTTGSARSMEILCHALTQLASRGLNLGGVFLNLQADNCCKELKNNGTLRPVALWTALNRISGSEIAFLQSGHSHEDIDGFFSLIHELLDAGFIQGISWRLSFWQTSPALRTIALCSNADPLPRLETLDLCQVIFRFHWILCETRGCLLIRQCYHNRMCCDNLTR